MLYAEVGRRYHWVDRLAWTDEEIARHLNRDEISIWTLKEGRRLAGYFELVEQPDGSVEIGYFGLLHEFLGRGLGKYLLTEATRRAWESGANRVWLHTCTLDHPAALPNYLARGFREFKRETYTIDRRPKTEDRSDPDNEPAAHA
jgi:GNAT superfamily N-acetyltransferase